MGVIRYVLALTVLVSACLASGQQKLMRSNVFLIMNQPKYAPGDTVFFKAYFRNEDNTPVKGKQILELNLLDEEGLAQVKMKFNLKDGIGTNQFAIPSALDAGIYQLTIHSSYMMNFDPPGLFQQELKVVSRNGLESSIESKPGGQTISKNIKVELSSSQFGTRENVDLKVNVFDNGEQPVEGKFSVRVLNEVLFEGENGNLLSQQVSSVEAQNFPGLYAEPKFFYSSVLEKNGTAYNAETGEPLADFTQVVFYLQNSCWRYQTFSNNGGRVSIVIPDFYGEDEFLYLGMTKDRKEVNNIRIEWDEEPTPELPSAAASTETNQEDAYGAFAEKRRIINQSYGFFNSAEAVDLENSKMKEIEDLLGGADVSINVDDYNQFSTMSQLIKEVIKFMKQRGKGENTRVRVSLLEPPIGDPLYIIDGIATKNTAFFLSLEPKDLKTIKIIKDQYKLPRLGLFGKNGIVLVESKTVNIREPLTDDSKLIQGLNQEIAFDNITNADIDDRSTPLFRSTIFWQPSVSTDQNGQANVVFRTSDDTGSYRIIVEGFTAEGEVFSTAKTIEVKAENP